MKKVAAAVVAVVVLVCAPSAGAAIPSVFGGQVRCSVQGNGVRFCGSTAPRSTVKAFDGVPIDVNVAFPPQPASGPDGNYPLVMIFHGYGGGKLGLSTMQHYLDMGYATFSMTDRGFRESCGSLASRAADPSGCATGYVRLIDNRYEVRDAQDFAGKLADEGLVAPKKIGAIGGSYGGGMSIALAALKNRMMLPDGSLVPWKSPGGKPMEIAAAAPFITWSDLAYSLTPNGSTLDYVASAPYRGRFGVMKESLVNGLYVSGLAAPGFYAPAGSDPSADITGWRTRLLAGEPYDGDPTAQAVLDEIKSHHSAFYIPHDVKPAPLLLANSFTDDLFPVDEMVRFYNRTRDQYPNADISLFAAEIRGHPRSQTKPDALARLQTRQDAWFNHYLKGSGKQPPLNVTAMTETCPSSAPSGGPISAPTWAKLSRGEIRLSQKQGRTDRGRLRGPGDRERLRPGHRRRRLRDRERGERGRHGQLPDQEGAQGRLPAARLTDRGRRLHAPREHLPGGGAPARRQPRYRSRDAGGTRPLAAGDRGPGAAGLPAAPGGLARPGGSRGEAGAARQGRRHRAARRLRAALRQPAGGEGEEPGAAPAGAGEAGGAARRGPRAEAEVRAQGLQAGA